MNDTPSEETSPRPITNFMKWGRIADILLTLVSIGVIAISFFAYRLGLDSDQEWGLSRKILLYFGLGGLLISQHKCGLKILAFATHEFQRFLQSGYTWFVNLAPVRGVIRAVTLASGRFSAQVKENRFFREANETLRNKARQIGTWVRIKLQVWGFLGNRTRQRNSLVALLSISVVLFYIWLTSVGSWYPWPATTNYYDRLAEAFLHGQTSLIERPKYELLHLQDPYEVEQREGISYLWDASLYDGKYYLYWGPAPAIVLLPIKLFTSAVIGDQVLTFFFVCGAFLFGLGVLLVAWDGFPSLPVWMIAPAILGLGLINPMPWLLSRPAIYEAAISSGQFFYLAGLYILFRNLHKKRVSIRSVVILSFCWTLSIGSRATLLPAIASSSLGGVFLILNGRYDQPIRPKLSLFLAMFGPLLAGICLSGWYNFARFGSVFDFGHRYQLTGMNLNSIYSRILSIANVVPNAYNYLLNPMRTLDVFPYFKPHWGSYFMPPVLGPASNLYYSEQVTGMLRGSPYLFLALIPVLLIWCAIRKAVKQKRGIRDLAIEFLSDGSLADALLLTIGATLLFMPILLFIVCTMRYLADVVPALAILSSLGFWMGYRSLEKHRVLQKAFSLLAIGLATYTVLVGMLLAITGYSARFEHLNLDLFEKLTRMFTF
jgi:hypothetical protein